MATLYQDLAHTLQQAITRVGGFMAPFVTSVYIVDRQMAELHQRLHINHLRLTADDGSWHLG